VQSSPNHSKVVLYSDWWA